MSTAVDINIDRAQRAADIFCMSELGWRKDILPSDTFSVCSQIDFFIGIFQLFSAALKPLCYCHNQPGGEI